MSSQQLKSERLCKHEILRGKKCFETVFSSGDVVFGPVFSLRYVPATDKRVAFAVSKRAGNAVYRNRVKRILRDIYRKQKHLLGNYWIVCVVGKKNQRLTYNKLLNEFLNLILKANLVKERS